MTSNPGDLTGQTLGTCTLIRLLGEGGMGAVYLAQQLRPSRNVAVKVLLPNLATNSLLYEEFLERFRREADMVARLEHVNIMPIHEYDEQQGMPYLVMPYITGGSLRDILLQQGPIPLSTAVSYIEQACSALDYAHAQGVIHRDLKPANFLLHADGRLILADFGIARMIEHSDTSGATLTSAGSVIGTPEYMAPEMISGEPVDYRADIYELGIVLFQMLSGHVPFTGSTPFAVAAQHLQEPLPLLQTQNPTLPSSIDAVIQKATAKQRSERYHSALAMAQALRQASSMPVANWHTGQQMDWNTATPSTQGPLVLAAPAQSYAVQARPYSATFRPATARNMASQVVPAPYRTSKTQKNTPWGLIASILIGIIIVAVGILAGIQLSGKSNGQNTSNVLTTQAATTPAKPVVQPTQAPVINPATIPAVTLPTSAPIYTTPNPGCEKRSPWVSIKAVRKCNDQMTTIISNAAVGAHGGIVLNRFREMEGNLNYTIQAQLQAATRSTADFGIDFRSTQQGGYAFLIHPNGRWNAYIYDNQTGTFTSIAAGDNAITDPQTPVQLTIATNGSQFSFYSNGNFLGNATDTTYASGQVAIVVAHNGTISVNNFALYAVEEKVQNN